jgi:hypothetical protein
MGRRTRHRTGRIHGCLWLAMSEPAFAHSRQASRMARPAGLEPATPGLEGRCSVHVTCASRNRPSDSMPSPAETRIQVGASAATILPERDVPATLASHCRRTVAKLLSLTRLELARERKQVPQVVENIENPTYAMEPLEGRAIRPRQVRYQAALRPDSNSLGFLSESGHRSRRLPISSTNWEEIGGIRRTPEALDIVDNSRSRNEL